GMVMNAIFRLIVLVLFPIACMQAQIPSYVPTNGLIGWWPFNGNANDESGNGNHGIVNGATFTIDRRGEFGKSFSFDGLDDDIVLSPPVLSGQITISFWALDYGGYPSVNAINPRYISTEFCNGGLALLNNYANTPKGIVFTRNRGNIPDDIHSLIKTTDSVWQFITLTYDGNDAVFYVNGAKISSVYNEGPLVVGTQMFIGNSGCGSEFFNGKLDDVGLWNRALTQNEISALYLFGMDTIPIIPTVKTISTVSCFGGNDGIATVTHEGGIGPYTYAWNTNPVQTTQTATNLSAGTYTVTVKDSRDSIATASITITQPPAITNVTATVIKNVDCFGEADGSASVSNPTGGTPPYSYSWNTIPAQKTKIATYLKAGDYTVTITDSKGCISQAAVTITQPNSPVEIGQAIVEQYVSCHGLSDGIIYISAPFGGTAPYTIVWNTQPVRYGERLEGVEAGTYTAVVIDSKGCIAETTMTVTEPEKIRVLSPKDTIVLIQSNALFYAKSNNEGTTYQWQTNLGIGFQDIQEIYQYTGTKTPILNIANCSFYNRNQPFRCILKTNGCYDTTEIATLSIRTNVSVDDDSYNTRLSISPNPTGESDQFLVRFAEIPNQDVSIELLDILGSVHYSNTLQAGSESCTIPVQGLSSGMYMLRVRMNNEVFIEKVIVN
ncbi:MAG: LamG-like jellyroll fold domain-containing protein, partial [Ignavibacteria bacterium]